MANEPVPKAGKQAKIQAHSGEPGAINPACTCSMNAFPLVVN
jgi:hypothetical protein